MFSGVLADRTGIFVFDAATPAAAPAGIDPGPGTNRFGAAIGGNTVAYIDFGLEAHGELVIHDLDTAVSNRITNDTAPDGNPAVSPDGRVVTWEHCLTSVTDCDIWQAVRTGASWSVSTVANTTSREGNPRSNGTLVAYIARACCEPADPVAPSERRASGAVGGGRLGDESAHRRGFHRVRATSHGHRRADIFVYDVANNRLFQITNTPLVNEQLSDITALPDGSLRMVWASDEDGPDQRNVKGATFELPNIAPTLTASAEAGYGNDGVNPDLGSSASSFTYKVVYADFEHQAPAYVDVCIDTACHAMTVDAGYAASLHDGESRNGEQELVHDDAGARHSQLLFRGVGRDRHRAPARLGVLTGPLVSDLAIATTTLPGGTVGSVTAQR